MELLKFTIGLTPVTKKNSSRIIFTTGRPLLIPSAAYLQYEKDCALFIPRPDSPIDRPVNVKTVFYMPTKRKVDLSNLISAAHDILVHHGVLADDNSSIIVSVDGSRVMYDKENPRTEIEITEVCDERV